MAVRKKCLCTFVSGPHYLGEPGDISHSYLTIYFIHMYKDQTFKVGPFYRIFLKALVVFQFLEDPPC